MRIHSDISNTILVSAMNNVLGKFHIDSVDDSIILSFSFAENCKLYTVQEKNETSVNNCLCLVYQERESTSLYHNKTQKTLIVYNSQLATNL